MSCLQSKSSRVAAAECIIRLVDLDSSSIAVLSGGLSSVGELQADEGSAAHIFQLSIVLLVPMILLFLAMADGKRPFRSARPLALPVSALMVAFVALYHLEHYR